MKPLRVVCFEWNRDFALITEVDTLKEAKLVIDTLNNYEKYSQMTSCKRPQDNTILVEAYNYEFKYWSEWEDEETGEKDINKFFERLESNQSDLTSI